MIDTGRYKRLFVFGCSFTRYYWPTWADIMAKSMPQAEFYNFGISGIGNLAITSRISEANRRFKFNRDDLIMVMWSTMCREDRWFKGGWRMTGNIFTQVDYDDDFISNHVDTIGYLIRDLSMINLVDSYLRSINVDFVFMPSVPFDHQQPLENDRVSSIIELYDGLIKSMPTSMYELEMNGDWVTGHSYHHPTLGFFHDSYPTPIRYLGYLQKIGLDVSEHAKMHAIDAEAKLKFLKTERALCEAFGFYERISKIDGIMF